MESPALDPTSLHSMLKGCLLFWEADDAAIELIAKSLKHLEIKKGDPIVLEGELGEDVFFIQSGAVEIVKYHPELHQVSRVTILKPGTHFSEFSILNRSNRSASAFAFEDSVLYSVNGATFLKIVEQFPGIGHRLVLTLSELNHSSAASSSLEYFDPLSIAYHSEIPGLLPIMTWKKFGVLPLHYYPGILLLAVKDPKNKNFLDHCKALLRDTQINVVLIGESDFEQTLKQLTRLYTNSAMRMAKAALLSTDVESLSVRDCLSQSPHFHDVDERGIDQLVAMFEVVDVSAGEILFKPEDPPDHFYIVQRGQIELSRLSQDQQVWTRLRMRTAGQGLGEISMILNHPHSHHARATCDSCVLKMPKTTFDQLLNSGVFCINLARILALRLQSYTESAGLNFYSGEKPAQLQELSEFIPKQLMLQHQVVPFRLEEKQITLGIVNPHNEAIYSIICRYLRGFRVAVEMVSLETFTAWMNQAEPGVKRVAPVARKQNESTVVELNRLLQDGLETRASDLHLEPTGTSYSIRYRIDGVLSEIANKIPVEAGVAMVNRIKILSGLDISNRMVPQDGQFKINEQSLTITARVATTPTKQGEGAVLRLIRSRSSAVPLTMLAPDSRMVKTLKSIAHCKQGLFLVTGPTGSGKTTTLYSLIGELNRVDVKIISLEDPVELEIPGVSQIEINEKTGLSFERALKSTLRQDPDIVILGEIRDAESAKSVFEAALSGHLVISTLHTNNSFAVKNRLKEMGVPLGTMAAGLIGAMAQRLVRAICKKCRVSRPLTGYEKNMIESHLHLSVLPECLYEGKGCIICHHTGYHGRLPIMEVWQKNRGVEEQIAEDGSIESMLAEVRVDGFDTLFEFGLKMAINGLTTVEEVDRTMAGGL